MQMTRETYDKHGNVTKTETFTVPDNLIPKAKIALVKSERSAVHFFMSGILFPDEWQKYVVALIAIVNGGPGPLPDQPEYPEGILTWPDL